MAAYSTEGKPGSTSLFRNVGRYVRTTLHHSPDNRYVKPDGLSVAKPYAVTIQRLFESAAVGGPVSRPKKEPFNAANIGDATICATLTV